MERCVQTADIEAFAAEATRVARMYQDEQVCGPMVDIEKVKRKRLIIFLEGELGSGKTTWVRCFMEALGYTGLVKSPSYTLCAEHVLPDGTRVHHLDFYRLDVDEIMQLGFSDIMEEAHIRCIEWAGRAEGLLPQPDWTIHLALLKDGRREMRTEQSQPC